jgi:HPt (histidine-containing phosphotransfer) domain-containing protein
MACEISPEKLAELQGLGGNALVTKLLEKFTENSARLLADAQAALAAGDAAKVDYCIHTLKGSSLSLGFEPMGAILVPLNIETKAKNLTNCADALTRLKGLLDDVVAYKATKFPS